MSESDNIDLIRRFCATWAALDVPKILDFFADDAVYHNMPVQAIQGEDASRGLIAQFVAPFERGDWEITHIVASGDVVLTERIDRFIGEKNTVELPIMGIFEIRDGKIAAVAKGLKGARKVIDVAGAYVLPGMIDTHAHLFYSDFQGQLESVIQRAWDAGLSDLICVGLNLATSEQAVKIAEQYDHVWATVGVHPHDAGEAPGDFLDHLERMASHEKVVAIGEMGLDFFRNLTPPERQLEVFKEQLALAKSLDMPAIIHSRQADDAIYETVAEVGHFSAVVHCFSSDAAFARKMVDMGLYISFTGTVTFGKNHNAGALQEVGVETGMVETDCPYLTPVPHRGKTNEPGFVRHTAEKIAGICGLTLEEVAETTTANAARIFMIRFAMAP